MADACAGNVELKHRVERLLGAHSKIGDFLQSPAAADLTDVAGDVARGVSASEEHVGNVIDKYRLMELIGEGGFGSVFLAEQTNPVQRRVALKIIKPGMDSRQVIARFEAERQALAVMDHPNIAKVFDAGATESGHPYFVMELVKGVAITEYCDAQRLPPRARLELFIDVCRAIQHAHQKGVIHRDLKPSNVLVAMYDGRPVPKVIDFGVAKAIGAKLTDRTLFTGFGAIVGTLEYMPPEQAQLNELDADTRSDIYSLGVLLYELLTGSTPLDRARLIKPAMEEMLRIIRQDEPPKPSARLSTANALASIAANRSLEPKKLSGLVRGELDWIAMKCLEKDRSRRYETANGLANDVQRYLAGVAILAAPPSATYRLRTFVRRHRGPVLASGMVLLVLIAGVIGTTIGLVGQARQTRIAEQQRAAAQTHEQTARRQTAIASAVSDFQTDMLASADPEMLLGDKVTVLQAVTAAVKELDDGKLKEQPLVEASVRTAIGRTLRALGRYDAAEPNLRKALELRRRSLPVDDLSIATSLNHLGSLARELGKFTDAEEMCAQALKIRQNASPAGDRGTAESLNNVAAALFAQGKTGEAEKLFRETLELNRRICPPGAQEIATSLNNLATVLRDRGKFAECEPIFREALSIYRHALPAGHLKTASAADNLAALLQAQSRLAEAEILIREALETRRNTLPAGHPDVGKSANNLATLLTVQGRYADAEVLAREAVAIARNSLPAAHPNIAGSLTTLGAVLYHEGKLGESELIYRESVEMFRKLLPANHPDIALSLTGVAGVLRGQNKFDEAEQFYREALEICRKSIPTSINTAHAQQNLAEVLVQRGKFAEAEKLYREAMKGFAQLGAEHWRVSQMRLQLGTALIKQSRFAEAETFLIDAERAIAALDHVKSPRHDRCLEGLVTLYSQWDQSEPAKGYDAKARHWQTILAAQQPTTSTTRP
ncbi:MAG: serine/threonine protein kinase [Anaerolineae bacterium]|nr:serine/threonine protein kinase [Phycisphaerae bacterium]